MKKTILIILACFSYTLGMAQYGVQFENRGFESWANFSESNNDTYEPVHWHSGMSASGSLTMFLSKQIEPSSEIRPGSAGAKSIRLWPKSVFFTTANGNLTNGRMNADGTSATSADNYNYTQRSEAPFNTPITTVPDSLTVWVCFRSNASQKAQVRAVIHGDADFRCISNGTVSPADQLVASALNSFSPTGTANGSHNWRRLSIPFVNEGPCNDPRYILMSITTNETPGQGSTSDDLYVDDVLLIYNPAIEMGPLTQHLFVIGEPLTIPFTLTGTMSPDNLNKEANEVIAQLSDASGSFDSPVELGRTTTDVSGSLDVTIPTDLIDGEHYRIRLITTNYPMVSQDNGNDITITTFNAVNEDHVNNNMVDVEWFDLSGRKINIDHAAPGVYIARYRTANGGVVIKKILLTSYF